MVKYSVDSFSIDDINKGKIILVDKPINWTSFDVVKYIRKSLQHKFKIKKRLILTTKTNKNGKEYFKR